jgi:hypothetical protein
VPMLFNVTRLLIPMLRALRVATYEAYPTLITSHGITIAVGSHCIKLTVAVQSTAIVEIHALRFTVPFHWHGLGMRASGTGTWTSDVLRGLHTVQNVEIVMSCPVGSHADAQIATAICHKVSDACLMIAHQPTVGISIAYPAWYCYDIHIIKEVFFQLMLGEDLEPIVRFQRTHDTVTALHATARLVQEKCDLAAHLALFADLILYISTYICRVNWYFVIEMLDKKI